MLAELEPPAAEPVSVAELKTFLRLSGSEEDALLAAFLRTGRAMCEAFTRLTLMQRSFAETLGGAGPRRLTASPVTQVTWVETLTPDGATAAIPPAMWSVTVDPDGVATIGAPAADRDRLRVQYRAGLSPDWNGIPEPLRQGVIRLAAHLFANRDGSGDLGPPAAVAALWRPWRRIQL
jgi:uncharacterized phiE125 gp8 family phage protein